MEHDGGTWKKNMIKPIWNRPLCTSQFCEIFLNARFTLVGLGGLCRGCCCVVGRSWKRCRSDSRPWNRSRGSTGCGKSLTWIFLWKNCIWFRHLYPEENIRTQGQRLSPYLSLCICIKILCTQYTQYTVCNRDSSDCYIRYRHMISTYWLYMTMFGSWEVSKKLPLRWILERCPVKSRRPQGWKPWSPKSGSGEWLFIFIRMTWIIWITWISCISKGAKHRRQQSNLGATVSAEDTTSYLNAWASGGPTPQGCTCGGCSSGFQGARPCGGLSQSPNFDVHVQTICKSCAGQAKIVMPGCPYWGFSLQRWSHWRSLFATSCDTSLSCCFSTA